MILINNAYKIIEPWHSSSLILKYNYIYTHENILIILPLIKPRNVQACIDKYSERK